MPHSSRSRSKLSEEAKKKRRREQKKLSMRRARAKLDAVALEERRKKDRERYHRKKEEGLIKTIEDFKPREQRQIRKIWREKAKLRREKEKISRSTQRIIQDNTPPSSPCPSSISSFSRIAAGKAVAARNKRRLKAKNEYLTNRINILERNLAKYRMRVHRLKKDQQLSNTTSVSVKQKIHDFLVSDEYSRLTAGKKETITRRKVKKQIRLLNDTLLNLHKIFNNNTGLNISYETFRRHRPFWVIFPKAATRNTCLCSVHANNDYVAQALSQAKIIPYSTATDAARSLCCNNTLNVFCLERTCPKCSENTINFNVINGNDTILYQRWITKKVTEVIKGNEKLCQKTLKETVKTSHQLLVNIFNTNLPIFMQHLANIINQHRVIRSIKQNLTPTEGLLHIDFSENYCCKYGSEVQSAHFGGSKSQLSLHTCVYYSSNTQPPTNLTKNTSLCTISENLRHDPVFICAHLKPVIDKIKILTPDLKQLHILSDGPTAQYRNKTMFHLVPNYISKITNAETIMWHFSEAGHGKGAPDGVGGCVKRMCDNAVANGRDISDIDRFIECLKVNLKGIEIIRIDNDASDIQQIADANKIRPFKGTFKVHQLTWSAKAPNIIHCRRLSCLLCAPHIKCTHFEIGQIQVECVSYDTIETQSFSATPSSSRAASPRPASNSTASASTVTGPRTPTPPEPLLNTPSVESSPNTIRQPLTPRKINLENNMVSDNSATPTPKKSRVRSFFEISDSDDSIAAPLKKFKVHDPFFESSDDDIF